MGIWTGKLLEEQERALLTDMISIQDWLNNAIHNKVRQWIDAVVEETVANEKELLDSADAIAIESLIKQSGIRLLIMPRELPNNIKAEIVKRSKVKSAADKNKEIEELEK